MEEDQSWFDVLGGVINNTVDTFYGEKTKQQVGGIWPTAVPDTFGQYIPLLLIAGVGFVVLKTMKVI